MDDDGKDNLEAEFDDWAATYDQSVRDGRFPFMGYADVLGRILRLATPFPGMTVLDLGSGTGNLALHFFRAGCQVWGCDFSEAMLARAREKMPTASLLNHDIRQPLPASLMGPFDRIVSAYTFHHFPLEEKVRLLKALQPTLAAGGSMQIGDVAFADRNALEKVKGKNLEVWEDEPYWLADESLAAIQASGMSARYEQVSLCAGIFLLP